MGRKIKIKKKRKRRLVRKDRELKKFIESGQYEFWLAHGCNFINSNIEEAHWEPLFPGIYEDEETTREDVVVFANNYLDGLASRDELDLRASLLAAWACMDAETMLPFYEHLRQLQSEGIDFSLPKQNDVWLYFHDMVDNAGQWIEAQGPSEEDEALL